MPYATDITFIECPVNKEIMRLLVERKRCDNEKMRKINGKLPGYASVNLRKMHGAPAFRKAANIPTGHPPQGVRGR